MPTAPAESLRAIEALVEGFSRNLADYQARSYLETPVRDDFIDPLFAALGWDMGNTARLPEASREVVEEARIRSGALLGAPDYCFRIGGERAFFVEAKKPSENIGGDARWAHQLRRYAWNANVALSVLTDFEELAIYDCRTEPRGTDLVATDRVKLYRFTDFVSHWDEIYALLSKSAVMAGSLRLYAKSPAPRGGARVDETFLKQIEEWRVRLAEDIDRNNPGLSDRDLRYCVQVIIDRIVFLRMCEDRQIEPPDTLHALRTGSHLYSELLKLFRAADQRFNSGLFHFRAEPGRHDPDTLTPALHVSDAVLKGLIADLYRRAYDFSVIPVETLGQVYEQFLGYQLRREAGRVILELRPELQKIGGVYYTPEHIVKWIVEQTVGVKLAGKTPQQVSSFRVLDPACGSGSFLLGAYKYLLEWHRAWYIADGPEKHAKGRRPALRAKAGRGWLLTIAERKRILTTCVFGVDVDPQAVEVAKLSLLLAVLEGETGETVNQQLSLFHERALPDLDSNIRWGNSLVGPDFYQQQDPALFDMERRLTLAVFDWSELGERFDVVLGNPPYIDSEWMTKHHPETRAYCVKRYAKAASGNWDIFCPFIERAALQTKPNGLVSMIVPNKLGSAEYAAGARRVIASDNTLLAIRDYSTVPVFPVAVYPIIFVMRRGKPTKPQPVALERMQSDELRGLSVSSAMALEYQNSFGDGARPWEVFGDQAGGDLLTRMRAGSSPLDSLCQVAGAATVGEAYEIAPLLREATGTNGELRFINSGTIDPYEVLWGLKDCRYIKRAYTRPVITEQALRRLSVKRLTQAKSPKIVISGMTKRLECVFDSDGTYVAGKSTTIVLPRSLPAGDLAYIVAVLNSDMMSYYYDNAYGANRLQGGYLRIGPPQISQVPIRLPEAGVLAGHKRDVIEHVGRIQGCTRQLLTRRAADQVRLLRSEIASIARQIEQLVQAIYELTPEDEAAIAAFAKGLQPTA